MTSGSHPVPHVWSEACRGRPQRHSRLGATHFQADDRPADPCEQVWMDEDCRCAIRLNELLRSAPNVVQHLLSLSPCLTETFGR